MLIDPKHKRLRSIDAIKRCPIGLHEDIGQ
jgi:hypothetical protein